MLITLISIFLAMIITFFIYRQGINDGLELSKKDKLNQVVYFPNIITNIKKTIKDKKTKKDKKDDNNIENVNTFGEEIEIN